MFSPVQTPRPAPVIPGQPVVNDAIPQIKGEDILVPRSRLIREGAFVIQRSGVLLRAPTGEWIVAFAPDDPGNPQSNRLPPMVLVPNRALSTLEATIGDHAGGLLITLTGEVLVYHSRNYLLVSLYNLSSAEPAPQVPPPQPDQGHAPPSSTPSPTDRPPSAADDPRVLELISSLERTRTPGIHRAGEGDAPQPRILGAGSSGRDGALMVRQRGRLVRGGAGHWYFAPDTGVQDAQGQTRALLPCQTLMELERVAQRRGDGLTIELTGRIYSYHGQELVLPTMFLIAPPSDVAPLQ
ncbi:MAG: hypothetical protein KF866_11185 [Phycisphaeraceae bacterium]|nr:hypothetical protein [Phycisphaeraceae bacterium]MCW5754261.1 hypothetical protein [Phycisphaeraceae bacterium]